MTTPSRHATFDPAYHAYFTTLDGLRSPRVARNVAGLVVFLLLLLGAGLWWIPWLQTAAGGGQPGHGGWTRVQGCIQAHETFDDPNRSPRGRTITTAFLIHLKGQRALPKVKGSDDAVHAEWVPIADLQANELFEDHYHIIQVMLGKLRTM